MFSSFQTAGGSKVNVSKKSLDETTKLFEDNILNEKELEAVKESKEETNDEKLDNIGVKSKGTKRNVSRRKTGSRKRSTPRKQVNKISKTDNKKIKLTKKIEIGENNEEMVIDSKVEKSEEDINLSPIKVQDINHNNNKTKNDNVNSLIDTREEFVDKNRDKFSLKNKHIQRYDSDDHEDTEITELFSDVKPVKSKDRNSKVMCIKTSQTLPKYFANKTYSTIRRNEIDFHSSGNQNISNFFPYETFAIGTENNIGNNYDNKHILNEEERRFKYMKNKFSFKNYIEKYKSKTVGLKKKTKMKLKYLGRYLFDVPTDKRIVCDLQKEELELNLENIVDHYNESIKVFSIVQTLKTLFKKTEISDNWIEHHLKLVLHTLNSSRILFRSLKLDLMKPKTIFRTLEKRVYDELVKCKKSSLKKVLENDESALRMIVLYVSRILGEEFLELSDNWYFVKAKLDPPLSKLVKEGEIQVGDKLKICNAILVKSSNEGIDPLDQKNSFLRVNFNSVRRSEWDEKLGHKKYILFRQNPLYTKIEGGLIPSFKVCVVKRLPQLYFLNSEKKAYYNEKGFERLRAKIENLSYNNLAMNRDFDNKIDHYREMKDKNISQSLHSNLREKGHRIDFSSLVPHFYIKVTDLFNEFYEDEIYEKDEFVIVVWRNSEELYDLLREGVSFLITNLKMCKNLSFGKQFATTNSTQYQILEKPTSLKKGRGGVVSSSLLKIKEQRKSMNFLNVFKMSNLTFNSEGKKLIDFKGILFHVSKGDRNEQKLFFFGNLVSDILVCLKVNENEEIVHFSNGIEFESLGFPLLLICENVLLEDFDRSKDVWNLKSLNVSNFNLISNKSLKFSLKNKRYIKEFENIEKFFSTEIGLKHKFLIENRIRKITCTTEEFENNIENCVGNELSFSFSYRFSIKDGNLRIEHFKEKGNFGFYLSVEGKRCEIKDKELKLVLNEILMKEEACKEKNWIFNIIEIDCLCNKKICEKVVKMNSVDVLMVFLRNENLSLENCSIVKEESEKKRTMKINIMNDILKKFSFRFYFDKETGKLVNFYSLNEEVKKIIMCLEA